MSRYPVSNQHALPKKRKARSRVTKYAETDAMIKNYDEQYRARRSKQSANVSALKGK